jgi:hypothetical protein
MCGGDTNPSKIRIKTESEIGQSGLSVFYNSIGYKKLYCQITEQIIL